MHCSCFGIEIDFCFLVYPYDPSANNNSFVLYKQAEHPYKSGLRLVNSYKV